MSGRLLAALGAGLLFAVGLGISGMTLPTKVIGFLDFFGDWDPSLAFVMGGAVAVHLVLHRLILRRPDPVLGGGFRLPARGEIDGRLVGGSALFGIGWGMGGFCPGPALVGLVTFLPGVLVFVGGMVLGMGLFRALFGGAATQGDGVEATAANLDCG
jgi:uncharacterized protein